MYVCAYICVCFDCMFICAWLDKLPSRVTSGNAPPEFPNLAHNTLNTTRAPHISSAARPSFFRIKFQLIRSPELDSLKYMNEALGSSRFLPRRRGYSSSIYIFLSSFIVSQSLLFSRGPKLCHRSCHHVVSKPEWQVTFRPCHTIDQVSGGVMTSMHILRGRADKELILYKRLIEVSKRIWLL